MTITAGVPTVWMAVLQALDAEPERWDLSALDHLIVGGSAAPPSMIEGFDRHGLTIIHAWGMTEISPLGSVSRLGPELDDAPEEEQLRYRARQGTPTPFVEIRARNDDGELVAWDDEAMGELEVRGPWVARGLPQRSGRREVHRRRLVHDRRRGHDRRAAAVSRSATAPRTSSSPGASGSRRSTSRTC